METENSILIIGDELYSLMLAKLLSSKKNVYYLTSLDYNEFNIEHSIFFKKYSFDSFETKKDNIIFLEKELGITLEKEPQRKFLFIDNYIFNYPLSFFNLIEKLNLNFFFRAILSFISVNRINRNRDSYERILKKRYGKILYEFYFKKYVTNEFPGISPDDLDSALAQKRVRYNTIIDVINNIFFNKKETIYNSSWYYFPTLGFNTLLKNLSQEVSSKVIHISIDKLISINKEKNDFTFSYFDSCHIERKIKIKRVYSTLCVNKLHNILFTNKLYLLQWSSDYYVEIQVEIQTRKINDGLYYVAKESCLYYKMIVKTVDNEPTCTLVNYILYINQKKEISNQDIIKNNLYDTGVLQPNDKILSINKYALNDYKPTLYNGYKNDYKFLKRKIDQISNIVCVGSKAKYCEFSFEETVNDLIKVKNEI